MSMTPQQVAIRKLSFVQETAAEIIRQTAEATYVLSIPLSSPTPDATVIDQSVQHLEAQTARLVEMAGELRKISTSIRETAEKASGA